MVTTVGERLRAAIEESSLSVVEFTRRLEERPEAEAFRGTSRAMIYRYFSGDASPTLGLLEAAAEILGVRLSWLVTGEGQQTEAEEDLVRPMGAGVELDPVDAALREAAPPIWNAGPAPWATFLTLMRRLSASRPDWRDPMGIERLQTTAEALHRLLEEPVIRLCVDWGEGRALQPAGGEAVHDYYAAALGALLLLVPPRGEGMPGERIASQLAAPLEELGRE